MNGQDNQESRKALAEGEAKNFKTYLTVPQELVFHVHEGFDPILVTNEVVDTHFLKILNAILDFDETTRSDGEFIESMKDVLSDAIGEAIDEL